MEVKTHKLQSLAVALETADFKAHIPSLETTGTTLEPPCHPSRH